MSEMNRQRNVRVAFTDEDDVAMWQFLLDRIRAGDRDAIDFPKGHNIWKKAERRKLCDGRSFTNLQSRFTRYLLPNLDESELSLEEINELKTAWRIHIKRTRRPSDGGDVSAAKRTRRVIFDELDTDDSDEPTTSSRSRRLVSLRSNKDSDEKCEGREDGPSDETDLIHAKTSLIVPKAQRHKSDIYTDESSIEPETKEQGVIVEDSSIVDVIQQQQAQAAEIVCDSLCQSKGDDPEQNDEANGASKCAQSLVTSTLDVDEEGQTKSFPPLPPFTSNDNCRSMVDECVQPSESDRMDEGNQKVEAAAEQPNIPDISAALTKESDSADRNCLPADHPIADEATKEAEQTTPHDPSLQSIRKDSESDQQQLNIAGDLLETQPSFVETAADFAEDEQDDESVQPELCEQNALDLFAESLDAITEEQKRLDDAEPKRTIHLLLNRDFDVTPSKSSRQRQETLSELHEFRSQDFKTNVIRQLRDGRLDPNKVAVQIAEATQVIDQARARTSDWRSATLLEACAVPD